MFSNENLMAKIAINKSLLKEYKTNSDSRVVYMNNGDEFQIQLFNPETETIGAEVSINGKEIPGILVIRPGERIWLERYLTEKSKFKFTTYEVDDPSSNSQVEKAIQNNGEVKIRFYKEKENPTITWIANTNPYLIKLNDFNSKINYSDECCTTALTSDYCVKGVTALGSEPIETVTNSLTSSTERCFNKVTLNNSDSLSLSAVTYSAPIEQTNTIETGRVGKGSYSNQSLEEVNIEFNNYWFKQEVIKILPNSRKLYTANDLQKVYCTECGHKISPKFKFCPYCGAKCELYVEE